MTEVDHNSPALQQKSDVNAMALALLRIAVGFFFVIFGQYNAARFRRAWGSWCNQQRLRRRKSLDRVQSVRLGDASALADQG